jgi:hypothetical protein
MFIGFSIIARFPDARSAQWSLSMRLAVNLDQGRWMR